MKSRILLFVVIVGIGAIASGWIYQSQLRSGVVKADLVIPDNIDYFLTNLNYRVMNDVGKIDYEFQSRRLEHHNRNDVSQIEIPSLKIYRDADRWQIDSKQGELQHQANLLWLRDQVVMQKLGNQPMQLFAEIMRFEPDRDLVISESSVLMESGNSRIEAEQGTFDLGNKVYSFKKTKAIYYYGNS